ncbi:hypothetical protein Hanom_Chr07g00592751 [Helianthus anomalus]
MTGPCIRSSFIGFLLGSVLVYSDFILFEGFFLVETRAVQKARSDLAQKKLT